VLKVPVTEESWVITKLQGFSPWQTEAEPVPSDQPFQV